MGSGALATSVVVHAAGLGLGAWIVARSLGTSASEVAVDVVLVDPTSAGRGIELPRVGVGALRGERDVPATPEPELPGGGERVARPDQTRAGRGGADSAPSDALNLADSVDGLTLDRDVLSRLDRSQVQRIETAAVRRSLDDRRATPEPMEFDFLASGSGTLAERRPLGAHQAGPGRMSGESPTRVGGPLGGAELPDPESGQSPGAREPGAERTRAAAGLTEAPARRGVSRTASVALARPWVPRARAAVPAPQRGSPSDTVDSRQEVASQVRALLHASTAGGRPGPGVGGEKGGADPGSGGPSGPGSRSAAAGHGAGPARDASADPRTLGYFRAIERRLEPLWRDAFPEWAIAEGRGGVVIVDFTVHPSGGLVSASVHRPSGVPEFDRNVLAAVRRAAPFGPLPAVFGNKPLTLRMSFDAVNPAVGRDGPGRGQRRAAHE